MDLNLHSYPRQRLPDWAAAATAGFAAGAVVMVLELLWSTLASDRGPWGVSHMVAAIVMGPAVAQSNDYSLVVVAVALAAHYVLGVVFGVILALILAPFIRDSSVGMVSLAGAVFGALLYLLNFHGMTLFFPWFVDWRGTQALVIHLIFGLTVALLYWKLNRQN
ncbi:MAG: hypothetical protein ABIV07_06120 [Polaromonas sp.]